MDDRYCSRIHLNTLNRIRATHEVIFKNPMHSDPTYCCTSCIPHIRFETNDGVTFRVLRPRKTTLLGTATYPSRADHQHPKPIVVVGGAGGVGGVGGVANAGGGGGGGGTFVGGTAAGPPRNGSFAAGDLVVDQAGTMWVCTKSGSPGSWTPAATPTARSKPDRIVQVEMSPLRATDAVAVCQMVNNVLHRENQLSNVEVDCKEVRVSRNVWDDIVGSADPYVQVKQDPFQALLMGYPLFKDTALADNTVLIALKG
jgi:hypothetical protein